MAGRPRRRKAKHPWIVMVGSGGGLCKRCGGTGDFSMAIGHNLDVYIALLNEFEDRHAQCQEAAVV